MISTLALRPLWRGLRLLILPLVILAAAAPAAGAQEPLRVVTWNVRDVLRPEDATARTADFVRAGAELRPDVLLLQAVTSRSCVERIRDLMGLHDFHVVVSDFAPGDGSSRRDFEVAILSRFPVTQAIEYDPIPDVSEPGVEELPLTALVKVGVARAATSRGVLWCRIAEVKLTVACLHLKSSGGSSGAADLGNAAKRELVAAASAAGVLEDALLFPDHAFLVAGDFNVGHSDQARNGHVLGDDDVDPATATDLYDDTHALLGHGLVGGLRMRNLAAAIETSTFPSLPGSPIDNVYVHRGADSAGAFAAAETAGETYGSDHLPVLAWYWPSDGGPEIVVVQPIVEVDDSPLTICSFNIQFLGSSTGREEEALAGILADYDLVVVQELVAPPYAGTFPDGTPYRPDPEAAAFFDAMAALGFEFVLSEEDTGTGTTHHNNGPATEWWATFYKAARVKPAPDLPGGFLAEDRTDHPDFERVPYAFPFRSTDGRLDFVLVSVHLEPGSSLASRARRRHELASIARWIDANDENEQDFIIVGDMNIENGAELATCVPSPFVSLNDELRATNTSVNGPKPYDHVLIDPLRTRCDEAFDFLVIDLIEAMRPLWSAGEAFPGDPYDHDRFRRCFSDHHPVVFRLMRPPREH